MGKLASQNSERSFGMVSLFEPEEISTTIILYLCKHQAMGKKLGNDSVRCQALCVKVTLCDPLN
jgi:hypothetical protein